MATIEEQEALLQTLKFTPRKYNISLWGYGGEIVMGTVEKKVFDYFKHRRISVSDYAWDYDSVEELKIPEDLQPFSPGSWYECDNLAHVSGVNRDSGTIQITDEKGDTVFESPTEGLSGMDNEPSWCCSDEAWIGMVKPGEVVFIGRSNEKGTFFEGEIDLTAPFDIEKLELYYDEVDGEEIINSAYYNGEEIDNFGGSTDGKSSEFGFFLVEENDKWERYVDHDSIKYTLTDWFPAKVIPARTGVYEVQTAGKDSYTYQANWTGTRWIRSWQEDTPEAEEIKIKSWRGIDHDPDAIEWDPVAELDKIIEEHKEVIEEIKEFKADPRGWPF